MMKVALSTTDELETMDADLVGPSISTDYTDLYDGLGGDKVAYYTGEITGSVIEYGDDWISKNFNPYSQYPSTDLSTNDRNVFNHSEFNVLLNNISSSRLSLTRQNIEFIYGTTGSILSPAYLQDSNESLFNYQRSRYEGVKVRSLLYNTYTSASYTSSDGLTYNGDSSYGKTAAIDKNTRKIGLFTEIASSSFLPGRNIVALKYLVNEYGELTELNQRNKHWEEIQRTFIAGDYLNVSQFDNQKGSNQKTTDGNKPIFESGYTYYPILYFSSCSVDPKIYFEGAAQTANSYQARASNTPGNISGSTSLNHRLTGSIPNAYVRNLFDNITEGSSYLTQSAPTGARYTAQETGDHAAVASFNLTNTFPTATAVSSSWILEMFVNTETTPRFISTQTFAAGDPATSTLTFLDYRAGDFRFTLSSAIPTTNVTITLATVSGYSNSSCTEPWTIQDTLKGTATISAGSTTVTQTGNFALVPPIIKYKRINSLTVNGISYSNGAKFYIGSTYVTLVIDTSCDTPYSC